jgi:hypothetical protein
MLLTLLLIRADCSAVPVARSYGMVLVFISVFMPLIATGFKLYTTVTVSTANLTLTLSHTTTTTISTQSAHGRCDPHQYYGWTH